MTSRQNLLIAVLLLTTITTGAIAWKQHQELAELRAAALNRDERADWQKRLWATEKKRAELETQVAAFQKKEDAPAEAPVDDRAPETAPNNARRNGPRNFMAMMDRPEVQRMVALQQKASLDARYSALFKNLALTPEQLEKFKDLLVEKRTAMMDVMAAARGEGISPRTDRESFDKLVAGAQADIDATIRATLGEAGFAQYDNFEKTVPQRAVVSQLEQRLSYSSTPLTPQQSDQMIAILAATTSSKPNPSPVPAGVVAFGNATFGPAGGTGSRITDTTINQALGVLAAPQIDALRQLQQEQQAQAALNATMRNRFPGGNAPASSTPPTGTLPAPRG